MTLSFVRKKDHFIEVNKLFFDFSLFDGTFCIVKCIQTNVLDSYHSCLKQM